MKKENKDILNKILNGQVENEKERKIYLRYLEQEFDNIKNSYKEKNMRFLKCFSKILENNIIICLKIFYFVNYF